MANDEDWVRLAKLREWFSGHGEETALGYILTLQNQLARNRVEIQSYQVLVSELQKAVQENGAAVAAARADAEHNHQTYFAMGDRLIELGGVLAAAREREEALEARCQALEGLLAECRGWLPEGMLRRVLLALGVRTLEDESDDAS